MSETTSSFERFSLINNLKRLIAPPTDIVVPELRYRIQLLLLLIIFIVISGGSFLINEFINNPGARDDADFIGLTVILIAQIPLYLRVKRGLVDVPAGILVVMLFTLITAGTFAPDSLTGLPYFIIIPIFLVSIFFPIHMVIGISVLAVLTWVLLFIIIKPDSDYLDQRKIIELVFFTVTSSGLLLIYHNYWRTVERYRRQELLMAYEKLRQSELVLEKRVIERTEELTRSREQLAEGEKRYRNLVENIGETLFTTDTHGKLNYVSPVGVKLTEYPESAFVGMHFNDFVAPDDRRRVGRFYAQQLRNAIPETVLEYALLTAHGQTRWVEQRLSMIYNEQGEFTGFQGIVRDISERKHAEEHAQKLQQQLKEQNTELLTARAQAVSANALKSQFLATMSHELRTPLNAIIGYAQLQLLDDSLSVNAEATQFNERVLANANHLLGLINGILDLSKIEAGYITFQFDTFNIRELVQEIMAQNAVLAEKKNLPLIVTIDPSLPDTITLDRGRLKQVIINLMSNAIKFTDRGTVTFEATRKGEHNWRFTVTDTGIGIPESEQSSIFDEFQQTKQGTERGGTGLGLAIVRKLVMLMGGTISVESAIGKGSTFTVLLPLKASV